MIDKLLHLGTRSLVLIYVAIEVEVHSRVLIVRFIRASGLKGIFEMLVGVFNAIDIAFPCHSCQQKVISQIIGLKSLGIFLMILMNLSRSN